jgi:hypothetical protein
MPAKNTKWANIWNLLTPLDSMHLAIFLENFLIFFNFYFKFENTSNSPLIRLYAQHGGEPRTVLSPPWAVGEDGQPIDVRSRNSTRAIVEIEISFSSLSFSWCLPSLTLVNEPSFWFPISLPLHVPQSKPLPVDLWAPVLCTLIFVLLWICRALTWSANSCFSGAGAEAAMNSVIYAKGRGCPLLEG